MDEEYVRRDERIKVLTEILRDMPHSVNVDSSMLAPGWNRCVVEFRNYIKSKFPLKPSRV